MFQLEPEERERFGEIAIRVRRNIISSIHQAQAGHPGGSLSAVELLIALYFKILKIDSAQPHWAERDRFILSKGHASIALYAVLAERGYFPPEELKTFDALDTRLQSHPDMNLTPGVDMSTGSLGQGLSAGVGMALGAKLMGRDFLTYVLMGDGELQEGQVWEAAETAATRRLTNLIGILDFNRYQLCDCGFPGGGGCQDPAIKFQAFGWRTIPVNGHDYGDILRGVNEAVQVREQPALIIAGTVKGKGVSFMEDTCSWHARATTAEEYERALNELRP